MSKLHQKVLENVHVEITTFQPGNIFTVAVATADVDGRIFSGEGIARRSKLDAPIAEKGKEIASGRAVKALAMKIARLRIGSHQLFMG